MHVIIRKAIDIMFEGMQSVYFYGSPVFDRIEYPGLISLVQENKRLNLETEDKTVRKVLEDRASQVYNDGDRIEKTVIRLKKAIDHDIEILEKTINILRKEVQKLEKQSKDKHTQIARWVVNYWGEASKFILGNHWEQYKSKNGRPQSFNSTNRWRTIKVMLGDSLSSQGFKDSNTGNYYSHYHPKMLVILAYEAYLILYRNEAITAKYEDLAKSKEGLKKIIPAYFDLVDLIYEKGPITLFHWDNVACLNRKELLEKVKEQITSLL